MMGENGEEAAAAVEEIQVAGPTVQAIRVVTETRNLRTQPFAIPDETNAVEKLGKNGSKVAKGNLDFLRFQRPWTKRMG